MTEHNLAKLMSKFNLNTDEIKSELSSGVLPNGAFWYELFTWSRKCENSIYLIEILDLIKFIKDGSYFEGATILAILMMEIPNLEERIKLVQEKEKKRSQLKA